jgi:hypothetical protein
VKKYCASALTIHANSVTAGLVPAAYELGPLEQIVHRSGPRTFAFMGRRHGSPPSGGPRKPVTAGLVPAAYELKPLE